MRDSRYWLLLYGCANFGGLVAFLFITLDLLSFLVEVGLMTVAFTPFIIHSWSKERRISRHEKKNEAK